VLAIGGMPDHIHLLVLLANTISMTDFMHHVKGGSSRFISEKLKMDGWFGWQKNYAAFAVSWSHRQKVIAYIENQKQHHADGTLWAEAEETDEEDDSDDVTLSK
jgi:putative transposase